MAKDHDRDEHRHGDGNDQRSDPVIARALVSVPVPPRAPDFLDRLDDALDGVDGQTRPATAASSVIPPVPSVPLITQRGETVPTDLTGTRPSAPVEDLTTRRRDRNSRRYRLLAAAASVAVVIGGVAFLTADDGPTTTVAPAADGTGERGSDGAAAVHPSGLVAAFDAVMDWSRAVDEGRVDRSWELMGPLSHAYLSQEGRTWESMVLESAEGSHAAWHRSGVSLPREGRSDPVTGEPVLDVPEASISSGGDDGRRAVVQFLPGSDRTAAMVELGAPLELEGYPGHVTDAFPLALDDTGRWKIEAFAFGPGDTDAEYAVPAVSDRGGLEDLNPDAAVEVFAPDGDVFVAFDTAPYRPMQPAGDGRWTSPHGLAPGAHQITVVTRGETWFTAHPARTFVTDAEPASCENIAFTPNSEDLASRIEATGGDCSGAEQLVRHVHTEARHDFTAGPGWFTALPSRPADPVYHRFDCIVKTESFELPVGHYSCTDAALRVTWDKT